MIRNTLNLKLFCLLCSIMLFTACGSGGESDDSENNEKEIIWRVKQIKQYEGETLAETINFVYDSSGFLKSKGSTLFEYDEDKNLESASSGTSEYFFDTNEKGQVTQEEWDDDGYITFFIYSYENDLMVREDEYDTSIASENLVWTDHYRYEGNRLIKREGDTNDDGEYEETDTYTYNSKGVLQEILSEYEGGSDLDKFYYEADGNISKIEHDLGNDLSIDETTTYEWEQSECTWGLETAIVSYQLVGQSCL